MFEELKNISPIPNIKHKDSTLDLSSLVALVGTTVTVTIAGFTQNKENAVQLIW